MRFPEEKLSGVPDQVLVYILVIACLQRNLTLIFCSIRSLGRQETFGRERNRA